jgi:hypothetical protein
MSVDTLHKGETEDNNNIQTQALIALVRFP